MKSCQFFNRTPKVEEVVLSVEPKSKAPSRSLSIPSARIQTPQVWSGELIQSGIWSTVQSLTAPQLRGFFWTTILLRRYRKNNRRDSLIRVYYFDVIDRGYPRHRSLWYGLNTATTNTTKLSRSYVKTVHSLVHHYLPRYVIRVCTLSFHKRQFFWCKFSFQRWKLHIKILPPTYSQLASVYSRIDSVCFRFDVITMKLLCQPLISSWEGVAWSDCLINKSCHMWPML